MRLRPFAVGLALTALLVGAVGLVAVNKMATQTVQEEHTYPFTGSSLSVEAALGSVQIVSGDPGQIVVRRQLTYGLRRPAVEERVDGNTFRVRDEACPADVAFPCHVRWLLQVPRSLDVEVRTASGAIRVTGLAGKVKLTSDSGEVRASGPSGKLVTLRSHDGLVTAQNISSAQVVASSDNNAVQLTFRSPPALVVGRSQRGQVGVVLPEGEDAYKIKAKSQTGSRTVAAKTSDDAKRLIDIQSATGDVSVIQSAEN
jgi:Putative adhesin